MAHYETPQELQELQKNIKIPKEMLDIPQILAEKQARKLWTQPIIVNSKNSKILEALREFHEDNRIHEQLVTAEEIDSKYGNLIWFLDRYLIDGKYQLKLGMADPYMLNSVGKWYITEKTASIFKYIVKDTKTYPVLETLTETHVRKTWYLPDKSIDTGQGTKFNIKELDKLDVYHTEEKRHDYGCLPVEEQKNKQMWIPPLMEFWSWKPQLATWYPVQGLIQFAYHCLRQIWKNIVLVKPKLIGNISPQDMARILNSQSDITEFAGDFFFNLDSTGDGAKGSNLEIMQGQMELEKWMNGYKSIWDAIQIGVGFSPQSEARAVKTATEVKAKQEVSGETINLLKQLRIEQQLRLHDKALMMLKLWNGKGPRPYSLSIAEEEQENQTIQIEESLLKIKNNLSNYVNEIAKLRGVSLQDAEHILEENLEINKSVLERAPQVQESSTEEKQSSSKSSRKKED